MNTDENMVFYLTNSDLVYSYAHKICVLHSIRNEREFHYFYRRNA